MTAPRHLKALEAIKQAAESAGPGITTIPLANIPRAGLTTSEVAQIMGWTRKRVLREIQAGRIKVITGGRDYSIPTSEIPVILSWAEYVNTG